ncbi:MAG: cell division protein FtsA [Tannerellaceae bacterium]|jgi:cell division protein FtsA|nr:cell division protein FtsA [Tannerellaceae bacterium]
MAYTNFIAAIYLGTSRITGIVGRNDAGTLTVIAYETEAAAGSIIRGCVHNVKEAAARIRRVIQKLELRIPGSRIEKVYVGTGGQSIRSVERSVSLTLEAESIVTEEILDRLYRECSACLPDGQDVLSILPSACFLDGRMETEPVGVACSRIEARYNLIVARPSVRKLIAKCMEFAGRGLAGIAVSPLTLADVVLSEGEKNRGCALIDFGAGVTSLSVYKNGRPAYLCVIPLGSNLITRDIEDFLKISEPEAEALKRKYGNALANRDDTSTFQINQEQTGPLSVKIADFNEVVTARLQEILENVYDKLESAVELKALRAGIIITGKAANMENLTALIYDRLRTDVRYATLREDLTVKINSPEAHPDGVALGLLLQGQANCAAPLPTPPQPVPPPAPAPPPPPPPVVKAEEPPAAKESPAPPKKKKKKLGDGLGNFVGRLFDEP